MGSGIILSLITWWSGQFEQVSSIDEIGAVGLFLQFKIYALQALLHDA